MQLSSSFPRPVDLECSVADLLARIGEGTLLSGEPDTQVTTIASPESGVVGSLVYLNKSGDKLATHLEMCQASVIVVEAEPYKRTDSHCVVLAKDARAWFIQALHLLYDLETDTPFKPGAPFISPNAIIGTDTVVGPGTFVGAGCVIGSASRIGANCVIHPGTRIGGRCFVQDGVVLGSVGLGYHFTASGERIFVPHMGYVQIGNDVVIGSGSIVVRGQLSDTIIGHRARLGNLVNIGHNVSIGDDTAISSSTSIAGGVHIGARCNVAIGVTINAKIEIGDDVAIGLGSAVSKSVPSRSRIFGNPARPLPTLGKF